MKTEILKVSCPYCYIGHAEVPCLVTGDAVQVPDIRSPHKCVTCQKYIVLRPKVTLTGITMEQAEKEKRHVA